MLQPWANYHRLPLILDVVVPYITDLDTKFKYIINFNPPAIVMSSQVPLHITTSSFYGYPPTNN
jgi:hypothetical protein